jgi:hypothetical protein
MSIDKIIEYEKKLYFSSRIEFIKELANSSNKYYIWSYGKCLRFDIL